MAEAAWTAAWTKEGLARLDDVVAGHVGPAGVPGAAWLVARHGEVHAGVAGTIEVGGPAVERDSIFRISSMTKPVTAVAALVLVEACRLRLDDPLDVWLPELADREVLADPRGPIDRTVPAQRQPTVHDALAFRLGWGLDFEHFGEQPVLDAISEALGMPVGPPQPQVLPAPDEWLARVSPFPLEHQPGDRWLYHTGAEVLGVLVGRVAGQPFDQFLHERVFEPLGMTDTGFAVPPDRRTRFGAAYLGGPGDGTGAPTVFDPADGQWTSPPAFPNGGDGLVSTVDDFHRFGAMLLRGGEPLLSRPAVAAMTSDQLVAVDGSLQRGPDPTGAVGWGFGVAAQRRRIGLTSSPGSYGWSGGLGSSWANDPAEGTIGVILTNQAFAGPAPPAIVQDFWTCAATALAHGA